MLRIIDKRAVEEGYFCKDGTYKVSSLKPLDKLNVISSGKNMYIFSVYCLDTSQLFSTSCPVVRVFIKELFSDFIIHDNTINTLSLEIEDFLIKFINELIYFYELEREDCYE